MKSTFSFLIPLLTLLFLASPAAAAPIATLFARGVFGHDWSTGMKAIAVVSPSTYCDYKAKDAFAVEQKGGQISTGDNMVRLGCKLAGKILGG